MYNIQKKDINPLVYIILLNYNGYKDTIECINSLEKISYKNYKIVIVDNASTDDSEDILKNKFPQHILIQTGSNLGFAGGNNVGIKYALEKGADYILLLNNDTVVESNFLTPLIKCLQKDRKIGIAGGKINYYYQKHKIWAAGGYISKYKGVGYHYRINEKDNIDVQETIEEVSFLTGCMQLIKREVFEEVGLYDEDYFLYMEDVDFCYRVMSKGYKLFYIPESKIYHKVSSSTGEESPLYLYYISRNRPLFISKSNYNFHVKFIFWIFYISSRLIKILTSPKKGKYIIKGIKDYLIR